MNKKFTKIVTLALILSFSLSSLISQDISVVIEPKDSSRTDVLAPTSRFNPIMRLEWNGDSYSILVDAAGKEELAQAIQEDAVFAYINIIITQFINELHYRAGFGMSSRGLQQRVAEFKKTRFEKFKQCAVKYFSGDPLVRFHIDRMSFDGTTVTLPYINRESGEEDTLKYHLPDTAAPQAAGERVTHAYRAKADYNELPECLINPLARKAIQLGGSQSSVNRYGRRGCAKLVASIASFYGVRRSQIFISNGSDAAIDRIFMSFVNSSDEIVAVSPNFTFTEFIIAKRGLKAKRVYLTPENNFKLTAALLERAIGNKTKLVTFSNPNSPTGSYTPSSDFEDVVAGHPNVIFHFDEAYGEFAPGSAIELAKRYKNVIVTRTFSKAFGLGNLRVGYAISSEALMSRLSPESLFSLPDFIEDAATAVFEDRDFLAGTIESIKKWRDELSRNLALIPGVKPYPSSSNFILVDLEGTGVSGTVMTAELEKAGIKVRDISSREGGRSHFIRITVGNPEENLVISQGIKAVVDGASAGTPRAIQRGAVVEQSVPILVASPSAAGKDELFRRLKQDLGDDVVIVRRKTSRKMRRIQQLDSDLAFTPPEDILASLGRGELVMIEENYGGRLYAVTREDIEKYINEGKLVIVVVNPYEGKAGFLKNYPNAFSVFISPLSEVESAGFLAGARPEDTEHSTKKLIEVVRGSISSRGRDDMDADVRVRRAVRDMEKMKEFNAVLYNERDPMGKGGRTFSANYTIFKNMILAAARGAVKPEAKLAGSGDVNKKECALFELSDPAAKRVRLIGWMRANYPGAAQFIGAVEGLSGDETAALFSGVYRVLISENISVPAVLMSEDGVLRINITALSGEEDAQKIKDSLIGEITRNLPALRLAKPWSENVYVFGRGEKRVEPLSREEAESDAITRITAIKDGEFNEVSSLFQRTAAAALEQIQRVGFLKAMEEAVISPDWYKRRLGQEALARVKEGHPDIENIKELLSKGILDSKIGQVSAPALTGLSRLGAGPFKEKILEAYRDPHRAWARKQMIEALASIGDEECFEAILEVLPDRERSSNRIENRIACINSMSHFPPEKGIDVLIFELEDRDEAVREAARHMLASMGAIALPRLVVYASVTTAPGARQAALEILADMGKFTAPYLHISYNTTLSNLKKRRIESVAQSLMKKGVDAALDKPLPAAEIGTAYPLSREPAFWNALLRAYDPYLRHRMLEGAYLQEGFLDSASRIMSQPGYPYREEVMDVFIKAIYAADKATIMKFAAHKSEFVRAAVARSMPYISGSIDGELFSRFMRDDSWFVRKECQYGILESAIPEIGMEDIELISSILEDKNLECRFLARAILLHYGRVNPGILKKIINGDDWKIKTTAVPLIGLLGKEEAFLLYSRALGEKYDSVVFEAMKGIDQSIGEKGAAEKLLPGLLAMAWDDDPWVQSRAVQLMGSLKLTETEYAKVRAVLEDLAKNGRYGFVRAYTYNAMGNLLRSNSFPAAVADNTRTYLRKALDNEKPPAARWAILEALDIPETEADRGQSFMNKEPFRVSLENAVNNLNDSLTQQGYSGRIEEIFFEDSSYSKPNSRFLIGSDIDMFRVVYSGEIPLAMREHLRNVIWDMGVFIKPDEPEWINISQKEQMFMTAVDVSVYKRPHAALSRNIVNDFMEEKPLKRERCFRMVEEGVLTPAEIELFRKIQRCYALSTMYHFDNLVNLWNDEEKLALASLQRKEFITIYVDEDGSVSIRAEWATFTGRNLPVSTSDGPLKYAAFKTISERAAMYDSLNRYISYPRPSIYTDAEMERLREYIRGNNELYRQICAGRKEGFDYLVLTAKDEAQKGFYIKSIDVLRKEGLLPPSLKIRVYTVPDVFCDGNGSATCSALAQLARDMTESQEADHDSTKNIFTGKKVLIVNSGGESLRNPMHSVTGKAFAAFEGDEKLKMAVPTVISILKSLSRLPEKIGNDGGVVVAASDVILAFDASNLDLSFDGPMGFGFSGDLSQAFIHGFYVTDKPGSSLVRTFEHQADMRFLNKNGLLESNDKGFRVKNVDTDMFKFDPDTATKLAGLSAIFAKSAEVQRVDISLYKHILLAFLWDKKKFLSLSDDDNELGMLDVLWERLHSKKGFKLASVGTCYQVDCGILQSEQDELTGVTPAASLYMAAGMLNATTEPGARIYKRALIRDSIIKGTPVISADNAVIEESYIRKGMSAGQGSRLRSLWEQKEFIAVPAGAVLHQTPILRKGERAEAAAFYAVSDFGTGKRMIFFGEDIYDWMMDRSLSAKDIWDESIPEGKRSIWNARLFPLNDRGLELTLSMHPSHWDVFEKMRDKWLKADRVSMEDMARYADYDEILKRREFLRKYAAPDLKREENIAADFMDSIIERAIMAKKENQYLILGLDSSWIPNMSGAQRMIAELARIPQRLKLMGLDNIIFETGRGNEVAQRIRARQKETNTNNSNIIVLGAKSIMNTDGSNEFNMFQGQSADDSALLIGIDPGHLTITSGVRIIEMYLLAIKLSTGTSVKVLDTEFIMISPMQGRARAFIFTPIEPYSIEQFRTINDIHVKEIDTKA